MLKVIAALVPSAGLLFLFWLALRAMIEADRRERAAEAKLDRRARLAAAGSADPAGRPATAATGDSGHGASSDPAAGAD